MPCPFCNCLFGRTHGTDGVCRACGRSSPISSWGAPLRKQLVPHKPGTHGFKKQEQRKLGTTGKTHESEHTIGYEVLGRGLKRGHSELAREIENRAPAYQEHKPDHRAHIGTGNHNDYRNTGESSHDYRRMQGMALRSGRPGNAVQLNQLYYAYQPGFQDSHPGRTRADASFRTMADEMEDIEYWEASEARVKRVAVDEAQRAEMNLARITARTGRYPTRDEEIKEMKRCGLVPGAEEALRTGPALGLTSDIHGISTDGDCLFHAIWNRLHDLLGSTVSNVTAQMLREQAVGFLRYDPAFAETGVGSHEYFAAMLRPGTWGGAPEIMALAHVWGVRINVIAPDYEIAFNETVQGRAITIYYDGVGHYSIKPVGGKGGRGLKRPRPEP